MGGLVQTVPRKQVKSITPMKESLMYNADMLGLTAQALADIVTHLKSDDIGKSVEQ